MVYHWLERLSFALIAPACLLCQAPAGDRRIDLCPGCERDLPRIAHPCPRCGLPLPAGDLPACGSCLVQPPAWDACVAALAYAAPVSARLLHWKRRGHSPAGRVFTRLLVQRLQALPAAARPQALVPVPQHWRRALVRGFNPAEAVARQLGHALGIPLVADALHRTRATPHQQGLSARERRRNLHGAFAVRAALPVHIALVDDVVTTGSTAQAISTLLRQHGVQHIDLWCLARTPKPGE